MLIPESRWQLLAACLAITLVACDAGREVEQQEQAVSATQPTGPEWVAHDEIRFTYRNGEEVEVNSILESVGGGVAIFDYDRDGILDVAAAGGGTFTNELRVVPYPTGLFRGLGEWKFDSAASESGVDEATFYSHGFAVADYDNDGFQDVLVTGYGGVTLWKNEGDGTFSSNARQAGLEDPFWSTSAAWGDFNGDGSLDLFVVHYVDWSAANHPPCAGSDGVPDVCPPRSFEGVTDALFLSDGAGGFVASDRLAENGKGLGIVLADIDVDGDLDAYVANDSTMNFLYINDGTGVLSEQGLVRGVAVDDKGHPDGSMGVDVGDINDDGLPDLWVANFESEAFALYQNLGDRGFLYATPQRGINAIGDLFVGFGTTFSDFDLDGDEDIVVSNGHVVQTARQSPIRQQPLYLENRDEAFVRVDYPTGYFRQSHIGRGLASGDLDADGDIDLVVSHNNDPIVALENTVAGPGRSLSLHLVGIDSNRDGIGTKISYSTDRQTRHRQVSGGGSYLSHSDGTALLSWPAQEALDEITIEWPSGQRIRMPTALLQQANSRELTRVRVVESSSRYFEAY